MSKNENGNGHPNGSGDAANTNPTPGATRIALILDRSGSMASIREAARTAFNEAVERIVAEADDGSDVTLSLLTFNQEVKEILVNAPVGKARKLEENDYQPEGMTALYDATGHGIDLIEKAGAPGPNDGALVIVVSDGHENSSRNVTQQDLVERMQALEATGRWTFTFMCANVDITELRSEMRVEAGNAVAFEANVAGVYRAGKDLEASVAMYMDDRRKGVQSKKDFWQRSNEDPTS